MSLLVGLATLAALPLAQFLSLGYFLESSARVARSGRLRDGLFGVRRAARVGGLAAGIYLAMVPAWLVGSVAQSAALIEPGGTSALVWRVVFVIVAMLTFGHVLMACAAADDSDISSGRSATRSGWYDASGKGDCMPSFATASGITWPRSGSRIISGSDSWGFSARSPG